MSLQANLSQLNAQQQQAVTSSGHTLVVAGPGSGKTSLLTAKAALILSDVRNRVVAVTFTRASANELKIRTLKQLEGNRSASDRFLSGTFHSLVLSHQLRRSRKKLNMVSDSTSREFVRRAWLSVEPSFSLDDANRIIQASKSTLSYEPKTVEEGEVISAYNNILRRHGSVDMQDIIPAALFGMRDNSVPAISCTHMLVDEFQDADEIQLHWVIEHAKRGVIVTCVGDDDQSIYSFRGATGYSGMVTFRDTVVADTVTLTDNYRSKREILLPSIDLVSFNRDRLIKNLNPVSGDGGKVSTHVYKSPDDEAEAIVKAVIDSPDSWAVLTRTNRQLDIIEGGLSSLNVRYYRADSGTIWSRRALVILLELISAVAEGSGPGIDLALGYAGLPDSDVQKVHALVLSRDDVVIEPDELTPGSMQIAKSLKEKWRKWRKLTAEQGICISSITDWLFDYAKRNEIYLLEIGCEALCRLDGSLKQRLQTIRRQKSLATRAEGVCLTSMHGAKGMEYASVWIAGVEQGVVPSEKAPLEEERRLFYVAMTRAKNELHLSAAGSHSEFFSQVRAVTQ